jgi:serine/threonine-protein kinase
MRKIGILLFLTILLVLQVPGEKSYSSAEEETKPVTERTVDPEAHELYLKGRAYFDKWTAEDMKTAMEYFQKAIEKDPSYALPYAILADSYIMLQYVGSIRPNEAMPKAREWVLKALEIDDTLGEAHGVLGWIKVVYEWDWASGVKEYKRALELNPTYIDDHRGYAFVLTYMGRFDEAMKIAEKGLALDPLYPAMNNTFAVVLNGAGRYGEAAEHLQKSSEMFPDFPYVHINSGVAYLGQSKYEEALKEFQTEKELSSSANIDIEADHYIGNTYAVMGETDKAKRVLDDLEERAKETYVPPYLLARLYFVLGDHDKAYEWLDRAYEEHDYWLCELKIDSIVDTLNLRSDPRYQAMLKKIGLDK